MNIQLEALTLIVDDIDEFSVECERNEYTDTQGAWDVLNEIKRKAARAIELSKPRECT